MKKYSYNTDKYRFRELVSELFQVDELEKIHKNKSEWVRDEYKRMTINEENTTDYHDTFYKKLNENWADFYQSYD